MFLWVHADPAGIRRLYLLDVLRKYFRENEGFKVVEAEDGCPVIVDVKGEADLKEASIRLHADIIIGQWRVENLDQFGERRKQRTVVDALWEILRRAPVDDPAKLNEFLKTQDLVRIKKELRALNVLLAEQKNGGSDFKAPEEEALDDLKLKTGAPIMP